VGGIVALGQIAVHLHELEAHDLEAALLEAGDDPARQLALNAIGLDEDEGSLGHCTDTTADG
jgi:hypothetical protein